MSVIKINQFMGEQPSVSPRAMPAGAAQIANDLLAITPEFRPLAEDTVSTSSGVSNPKTIYKMSSGWRVHAEERNYVKGQINDDTTERTYYTFGDGSQPPRATDNTGEDRQLGVPPPTGAPTVTGNISDEFTAEDKANAQDTLDAATIAAIKSNLVPAYIGVGEPSEIYYKHFSNEPNYLIRAYLLSGENGIIADAYTAGDTAGYNWVLDPTVGGVKVQDPTSGGVWFYGIKIPAYANAFTLDATKCRTDLAALKAPGTETALLTSGQIDELITGMQNVLSVDHPDGAKSSADALKNQVKAVKALLDNASTAVATATVDSVYTSASVTAAVNNEIATFSGAIHDSAVNLVNTPDSAGTITGTPTATSYLYGTGTANRATSVAAITAEINSLITRGTDGVRHLDTAALTAYIYNGYLAIANTISGASNTAAVKARQQTLTSDFIHPYSGALEGKIQAAAGSAMSAASVMPADAASRVAALKTALAACKTAADSLSAYYTAASKSTNLGKVLDEFSVTNELDKLSADTVERIVEARFYIATFVTDWFEESAPGLVSEMIELDQNDSATVTITGPVSGRHIVGWRLYRSNAGNESAAFQLVADAKAANAVNMPDGSFNYFNISALTYEDKFKSSQLGEVCPSITWAEPPAALRGLVGMPNGMMAGFEKNYVALCDPYHPYAWPVEYQITTEHPIVGLGVFGQTLFVGTQGKPYLMSGSDSASMSAVKLDANQSCVSRKSIVSSQGGVVYASPDGLCLATQNGVQLVTKGVWTREDWQKLQPETIYACEYEGIYLFMCNGGTKCYALGDGKLVSIDMTGSALYVDLLTDTLYVANGAQIMAAFSSASRRTAKWKSGITILPKQEPFAWVKIQSDYTAPVNFTWTADGVVRHTATFNSLEPQRLPPGRYLEHEITLESQARITGFVMAGSTQELQSE